MFIIKTKKWNCYFLLTLLLIMNSFNQLANKNCKGVIKGVIVYSGEGVPSDLIIVATDTLTKKEYSTKEHETSKANNDFHFTLIVPKGVYYVYAETNDFVDTLHHTIKQRGYYTDYTRLGKYKSEGDASHEPISINVSCGDTIKNITTGDFWK